MRAIVHDRYGGPENARLADVPTPELRPGRVLVRVRAASVNRSDWEVLTGSPPYVRLSGAGFWRPKRSVMGSDVAGVIEAVGEDVTDFHVGDEVFGDLLYYGDACFAEYVSVSAKAPLVHKPEGLTFEQAAALPQSGVLALQGLRRVRETAAGDRVLINGAGGGGGTFAIQVARSAGAEVIAVDNAGKLDAMRSLGADRVIDYATEKYTRLGPYDRILDFVGSRTINANRRALARGGVYGIVGGPVRRLLSATTFGWVASKLGSKSMGVAIVKPNRDDLRRLADLVVGGTISPVVHKRYDLADVPQALADLGAGEVLGKAIVTI